MTPVEIGEALGVSRPTAHNLATTLTSERYLVKLEKPTRYQLGPAVADLLDASAQGKRRGRARELIEDLRDKHTGMGFVYAEALADEMRIIWRVDYKRSEVIERVDREVSHPYDTATALLFHAVADEHRAVELRRRFTFEDFGRGIWGDRQRFNDYLEQVRKDGLVLGPWRDSRELVGLAVPVFGAGHGLVGSVGAFWPWPKRIEDYPGSLEDVQSAAETLTGL